MVHCEGLLIDPETPFLAFNSNLHGIVSEHVAGAPNWKIVYPILREWLSNRTLVSHTYFDRVALLAACRLYQVEMFPYVQWVDSCEIARKAWPHLPGHKLSSLAEHFKIEYHAHDAAEDARVAGEILLLAKATASKPRHVRKVLR